MPLVVAWPFLAWVSCSCCCSKASQFRRKKDFKMSLKKALRKEMDFNITASEQRVLDDPLLSFGKSKEHVLIWLKASGWTLTSLLSFTCWWSWSHWQWWIFLSYSFTPSMMQQLSPQASLLNTVWGIWAALWLNAFRHHIIWGISRWTWLVMSEWSTQKLRTSNETTFCVVESHRQAPMRPIFVTRERLMTI